MATLTSTKIKNTYDALLKASDNDAIGSSAKQITDGLGNGTPLYISTTQIGIGVTPEATYDLHVYSNAKVGGNLTVTGDLTVEGTTTTIDTQTLTVEDPLIEVASNNTSTDAVDIGWYGKYAPSGTTLYAGLFRDTGDSKFKLFRNLQEQPTTTVNTSGTGYAKADLVIGNLEATGGDFSGTVYVDTHLEVENSSGFGFLEVGGSSGAYIDLKSPFSDDFDLRLYTAGTNAQINAINGELDITANTNINLQYQGTDVFVMSSTGVAVTGTGSFTGQVTIPETPVADTDAASKGYVDSQITAQDLDFSGDSGTGAVDLDSQTLSITGGTLITTTALNQNLDIDHNSVSRTDTTSSASPAFGGTFTAVDSVTSSAEGHITAINLKTVTVPTPTYPAVNNNTITINAGSNLDTGGAFTLNQSFDETITIDLATTITGLTSVSSTTFSGQLDGTISSTTTATTQTQGDNSTKVATTAYVDSAIGGQDTLAEILANGNTTGGTDIAVSTGDDITFTDTSKALFGASSDLQIYHDGSNSYINEVGTGVLSIQSDGTEVQINKGSSEYMARFITDAGVKLYYDNSLKFETTSTGVTVTGTANSNALYLYEGDFTMHGGSSGQNDIRWINTWGNWRIEVGDGANNFKIHSESLAADYLTLEGGGQLNLGEYGSGSFTGTATYRLAVDSSGDVIEIPIGGGAVDGSGTANYVTKWIDTDTIGNSILNESSNDIIIGYNSNSTHSFEKTFATGHATGNRGAEVHFGMDDGGGNVGMRVIDSASSNASFNAQHIEFHTHEGGVSVGKRMEILSTGNSIFYNSVGIGATLPDELLHLHNTSQNSYLYMSGGGSLGETYGGFVRGYGVSGQGGHLELGVVDAGTKRIGITIQEQGNQIEFDTAGTERMRIDSSGNVAIGGSTESDSLLTVRGADTNNKYIRTINNNGTAYFGTIADGTGVLESNTSLKFTTGSSFSERMLIDSSGRVGIGETPSSWSAFTVLQVEKASLASTGGDMNLMSNSYYDGTAYKYIGSGAAARQYYNTDGTMHFYNASSGTAGGTVTWNERMRIASDGQVTVTGTSTTMKLYNGSSSTGVLHFGNADFLLGYDSGVFKQRIWDGADYFNAIEYNGASHRLILAPSEGSVGIGTDSPSAKLDIAQGSASPIALEINTENTFCDVLMNSFYSTSATRLRVGTNDFQIHTNGSQNLTVTSAGAVGIGVSSSSGSRLHIKAPTGTADMCTIQTGDNANNNVAAIVFRDLTFTHCGEISVNGSTNTTSYNTGSDYRLKQDYQDFNGLDLVSNIPVYDFQWKKSGTRAYGVQAHELQEVLPQAVVGEKDGEKYQGVDYSKIVPVLLKSIQELKAEIETLKAQINN